MKDKLFVADAEGFVVDLECLPLFARSFGNEKVRRIREITKMGLDGRMPWREGYMLRIKELRGLSRSYAREVMCKAKLTPDVREIYQIARELGYIRVIVSGGPSILMKWIQEKLEVDYTISNELLFDEEGLYGTIVDVDDKGDIVRKLQRELSISRRNTVVVGDGMNDIGMFKCGVSIGYRPSSECIARRANVVAWNRLSIIPVLRNPTSYLHLKGYRLD